MSETWKPTTAGGHHVRNVRQHGTGWRGEVCLRPGGPRRGEPKDWQTEMWYSDGTYYGRKPESELDLVAINPAETAIDQRCKNCKHWDNDIYLHGVKHPYGSCLRLKMPYEIGDFHVDPESVLDEHPAYVEDGSDYHAALRCGPEFGCVLFEVKEAQ